MSDLLAGQGGGGATSGVDPVLQALMGLGIPSQELQASFFDTSTSTSIAPVTRMGSIPEEGDVTTSSKKLTTIADALAKLEAMGATSEGRDAVTKLQRQLYEAGYFKTQTGQLTDRDILWGDPTDKGTVSAYLSFLHDAVLARNAGTTAQDLLDQKIRDNQAQLGQALGGKNKTQVESGSQFDVTLSDPNTIGLLIDKLGTSTIGHRLSNDERAKLIGEITGKESAEQMKSIRAQIATRDQNRALGRQADTANAGGAGAIATAELPGDMSQAGAGAPVPQSTTVGGIQAANAAAGLTDKALTVARQYLGRPYDWGGGHGGVTSGGVDCSGLVNQVYGIGGTTYTQVHAGVAVAGADQAQPGDLVFFGNPSAPHHVGIYIGGGQMIDAPKTGVPVGVHNIAGYGQATFRRVIPVAGSQAATYSGQLNPLRSTGGVQVDAATHGVTAVSPSGDVYNYLTGADTVTTTHKVDPQADIETAIRQNHPIEAGATDVAKTFDDFLALIGVHGGPLDVNAPKSGPIA